MRRIAVLGVVVFLFRCHASSKFQEAISWTITWIFLLHCLSLQYVVSDHFRWSNVPVHQNKLKICLHFDQIRTWHRCLKLAFFGFYIYLNWVFENCSIRWSNDWNNLYETNDHSQQFRAHELSCFFKREAFTFSPASLIEFIQLWPEALQNIERCSRPFCLLYLIDKRFLFSVFSIVAFLSFPFFLQILNYVSWVFQ